MLVKWCLDKIIFDIEGGVYTRGGGEGGDLVPTMPGCVCPKVKNMGSFSALRE